MSSRENIAQAPSRNPDFGQLVYQLQTYSPAQGQQHAIDEALQPVQIQPPRPQNYEHLTSVTLLFCCFPISVVAMVFSCMVDKAYDAGDYERARRLSATTRRLNIASFTCGFIIFVGGIIWYILAYLAIY
ncbi:transmembrane protein 233-like [Porites lutea]|uniref:transmembrane protein 233-like n=1 Tax=Porites lutea TaxID=51062 RepID=UPI003CC6D1CE